MGNLFLKILNMSIAASWLILAVMLFRFMLKKAPKWIAVLLWGIVALRLVIPFSFESALSLIPSAETFNAHNIQYETPTISSGIPAVNNVVNPVLGEAFAPNPGGSINPFHVFIFIAAVVWLIGIAAMLLYAVISYVRVSRNVAERAPYQGNIFLCDHVKSPFILGLVCPKIYLPSSMEATAMEPVIAHEKAHLARRDHWWKPLGFLILTIHWFNPLCWIAYVLLCRDIELACDEKVIRQMDLDGKKQYSTALLECNVQRRLITICPLAFGEVGVKERVKNVLNYKKPAFWVIVLAIVACAVVTVCFATNPATSEPNTPNADRPMLIIDGVAYVNPYMPVSSLPYGYQSAGKLTEEQANNTGLEGIEYFVHPSGAEDFYTYQECGTPVALDTVDSTQRQWAYARWIQVENDSIENRKLTLDDVVMLSQKGDTLTWSDFEPYQGQEIGFGLYIMRYEIDELFEVRVGGVPNETPMYIYLMVNNETGDKIDIRTEDVSAFIEAHRNDVPKVVEPKPDGGGEPAPEKPDVSNPTDTPQGQTTEPTNGTTENVTGIAIVNIVDRTKTEGLPYDMAEEKFFEDGDNEYYFSGMYSHYVIVHYEDGSQEDIVTALIAGRASIADLDKFGVGYTVRALNTENVKPSDEIISQPEANATGIFDTLNKLDYQSYTCDGVPEYRLLAADGTKYFINFSENWVWRGNSEQAELPAELIPQLKEACDAMDQDRPIEARPDKAISQTEAQEIALNECRVNYDYITAEFDTGKNAWEIGFWEDNAAIAAQTISIDTAGRVLGISYAE